MTLSTKSLLIFIIATILHGHAFSQGDTSALSLYTTGESLIRKAPDKAFQLLESAMTLSRQKKEMNIYIRSINKLASLSFRNPEKQDQVFDWLKEAGLMVEDSKEDDELAKLHFYIAEFYNELTIEIEAPIFHYQRAKKIWTSLIGEMTEEVSNCYHGMGDIYKYYKFDFYRAEKCYEKALLIREKIQFQDPDVLYKNYYSLALTNRSQQDFEKALSYGNKAVEVAKNLQPIKVEMCNGMMANIYRAMGESKLAKKYYLSALRINEKTKNLETRAWYYMCLGETFKNDSLLNEALQYFKKAYLLYTTPEARDEVLFMNLLIDMIDTYSLMEDNKNFLKTIEETFRELNSLGKLQSREAAQTWLIIGEHHSRKKNYDSALFYYQKALIASVPSFKATNFLEGPSEDMIGSRYYVNEILAKKAFALKGYFLRSRKSEYLEQSLLCFKLAEKLLSKQRNALDMEDAKWEFLEANYDLYEDILSTLYEGAKTLPADTINVLAFQYFEQSKSRSLADALSQTEQSEQISKEDSLFRLHADLKRQLFSAQDLINKELEKPSNATAISKLREEVVRLDQNIQLCKIAIEEKYPGYFNVKYGYRTAPLREVQKIMKEKGQVLLEYFWGNKSVYALGVGDEKIIFHRIGSPDSVKALVNKLLMHLTDEHSSMNPDLFQSFTSNAHQLYKILVGPFMPLLLDKKRIHVIPDGPISQVPFEILLTENTKDDQVNYRSLSYMIKSFTVGYAYSSSMLINKLSGRRAVNPSLLAIGFTGRQRLRAADSELEEIEGAEEELNALEKRFNTGKFLEGNEATESNFKTLAPDFDIIHLAIHGMGDVQRNFSASLYFRSKYDSLDDGELHAYELYGLKLKAFMAVLSSCESGLGKGYKGEGMISMASAFTYSGCENILMSLWKVNDQASIMLMDNFYKYLLEGGTIDDALRQAKLNYLAEADELSADPKIWAPLVAYGSLDEVFQKDRNRIFQFIALIFIGILILFYLVFKKKIFRR